MRYLLAFVVLAITTIAGADTHEEPREALLAAVDNSGKAFSATNIEVLNSFLTDDYLHINGSSGQPDSRDGWLSWIASQRERLADGTLVINRYEMQDLSAHLFGDAAVVTGTVESSGVRSGEQFLLPTRITNLWIRQDRSWLRAAFHDTLLED